MSELKQARENYDSLTKEIKALSDNVKSEKRSYSKDETTKFEEMKQNAIQLQTQIADLEKFSFSDSLTRSLAGEDVPTVQIGSNYNSQKVSQEDHEMAIRGWINSASGNHASYEQLEAAEKCGFNVKSDVLDLTIQRAQYKSTNADGGYLAPSGIVQQLVERRKKFGGLRNLATVIPTTHGNSFNYPTNDDTGNTGDMVGEGGSTTNTKLDYGQKSIGAKRMQTGVFPVSLELIQDSAFPLIPHIGKKLGQRLSRKESAQFAIGDGTGNNCTGITVGATVGKTAALNSAITIAEWNDLVDSIDEEYHANASFCMNRSTWSVIRQLVDSNGRYLLGNLANGAEMKFLGYPIHVIQDYPSIGSANVVATFGDHEEGFLIRDSQKIQVTVLKELYLVSNNSLGFMATSRVDSIVVDDFAVKSMKMAV